MDEQFEQEMKETGEEALLPLSSDHYLCNTGWSTFHLIEINQMACKQDVLISLPADAARGGQRAKSLQNTALTPAPQKFRSAQAVHEIALKYSSSSFRSIPLLSGCVWPGCI